MGVMRVRYSPQRSDEAITYAYPAPDVVRVTLVRDGQEFTEDFDFGALPDGVAEAIEPDTMPLCPIVEARREGGELYLTLLRPHGPDAPASERFPGPGYQEVAVRG